MPLSYLFNISTYPYGELITSPISVSSNVCSPFLVSIISYQMPFRNETYGVLPFRMDIISSGRNFTKFLHQIENSGSLDSDLRLIDITSINLSFEDSIKSTTEDIITYNVQFNAYYQ